MSENMDQVFGASASFDDLTPVAEVSEAASSRAEKVSAMKTSLQETVNANPAFVSTLRTLSDSIEVINTLGYGDRGNLILNKEETEKKGSRVVDPTSVICGYRLRNNGSAPIEYKTETYVKNDEGKWVGTVVTNQWAPGTTIDLERQYMTMLCARPEISFTLANGKIAASSKKKSTNTDMVEELRAHYFSYNKEDGVAVAQVNDDKIKLRVDVDGVVTSEFEQIFGYLNNPKPAKPGRSKDGKKFTTQDLAANYIMRMMEQEGTL